MVFLLGIVSSICIFFYADLSPRLSFEKVNFQEEQKRHSSFINSLFKKDRYLATLPLKDYIKATVYGKIIEKDPSTVNLANQLLKVLDGHEDNRTKWTLDPKKKIIWTKLNDSFLVKLANRLASSPDRLIYLPYHHEKDKGYFRIKLHTFSLEELSLSNLHKNGQLPLSLFYPFRKFAWVPLVLGLIGYFLIPWPKAKDSETWRMSRAQVILGDFLSLVFFAIFFTLPFWVSGILQAVKSWWPYALIFWIFAFGGLFMLKIMAQYGSYSFSFIPGGFEITSLSLNMKILYKDLSKVKRAISKPPKWLLILTWIAAFFSSGIDQLRMRGQALLLSSSAHSGLYFKLKDGNSFFFWSGILPEKYVSKLKSQLKSFGLLSDKKEMEVRHIITDVVTKKSAGISKGSSNQISIMWRFVGGILATLCSFILLHYFTFFQIRPEASPNKSHFNQVKVDKIEDKNLEIPLLKNEEIIWSKSIKKGHISLGRDIQKIQNGRFLIGGITLDGLSDIFLVAVTGDGKFLWQKAFDSGNEDQFGGITKKRSGSFLISGTTGRRLFGDVWLFEIDKDGDLLWKKRWGKKNADENGYKIIERNDGTLLVLSTINYKFSLLHFSPKGEFISSQSVLSFIKDKNTRNLSVKELIPLKDGSLLLCGTIEYNDVRFEDGFLMKLDPKLRLSWLKTYGADGKQGISSVLKLKKGGFLFTGFKGYSFGNRLALWIAKTDKDGNMLWERVIKDFYQESGQLLAQVDDEKIWILSEVRSQKENYPYNSLRCIDLDGKMLWKRKIPKNILSYDMVPSGANSCIFSGKIFQGASNGFASSLFIMKVQVKE